MPVRVSRRERVRDATMAEIKRTARDLLVADGPEALTLRAIAREMGMTAPALYRYFDSHEDLLGGVCADVLADLTAELESARDAAGSEPLARLTATCRAFRLWSLAHRVEFRMVFASPPPPEPVLPPGGQPGDQPSEDLSFGAVFLGLFVEVWTTQPFAVVPDDAIEPVLAAQLRTFGDLAGVDLPLGVLQLFLSSWVRLYGAVTLEVFGHLGFALADAEPMFEAVLAELGALLEAPAAALRGPGR